MNDIVEYSEKVKNETSERVKSEQDKLCTSMKADEYEEVCDILDQNSTERKQTLFLTPGDTDAKEQVR